jgi:hypothetical protein
MHPTFLGIGAPKAGTTWLYRVLESHPDVAVPRHRKEIHYFDHNFERGLQWYEAFFPNREAAAVGEFTPHYLYDPAAPERVHSVPSIQRFLVILRNPVDRAFSHFRFRRGQDNTSESFEQFLDREPNALAWGHYGRHLAGWFEAFGPRPFLVLLFEDAVRDPDETRRRIAHHLALDPERFPTGVGTEAVNESVLPRRRGAYATAVRQARWLRRHDLDRVISLAKRSGVAAALKRPAAGDPAAGETVPLELRRRLWRSFEPDVAQLASLTGLDFEAWRPEAA